MIINMDAREFKSCISKFGKVINKTSPIPNLNCVRIYTSDGKVKMTASDEDHRVTVIVHQSDVVEEGYISCDYDDLKKMSGLKGYIKVESKDGKVEFCSTRKSYVIRTYDFEKETYPMPAGVAPESETMISADVLSNLKTIRAMASVNAVSGLMSGIHFDPHAGAIIALDGHRIAKWEIRMDDAEPFTLPARVEEILKSLIGRDDEYLIHVKINLPYVEFVGDGFSYVVRTIGGKFYQYKDMTDKIKETRYNDQSLELDSKELMGILKEYKGFIGKEDIPIMYMVVTKDSVCTGIKTPLIETVDILEDPSIYLASGDYEVGINPNFVIDAITFCGDDTVKFTAGTSSREMVFFANHDWTKTCLVLPRLYPSGEADFVKEKA